MIRSAVFLVLAVALAFPAQGKEIRGPTFRFDSPEGFSEFPQGKQSPDILYSFLKGDPADTQLDIVVLIERLRGTIGREPLAEDLIPKNMDAALFTEKWLSFELQGFRVREGFGGVSTITRNIQVPLKPFAIQIKVVGEESRDPELAATVRAILAGLKGETNWLTTEERASRGLIAGGQLLLVVAVVVGACVAIVRRRKRSKAR